MTVGSIVFNESAKLNPAASLRARSDEVRPHRPGFWRSDISVYGPCTQKAHLFITHEVRSGFVWRCKEPGSTVCWIVGKVSDLPTVGRALKAAIEIKSALEVF